MALLCAAACGWIITLELLNLCSQSVSVSFRFGYFGKEKLKEIKLLVCNIDGCLTNGHIYVSGDQKEIISYDVKDAIGISLLKKSGIEVSAPLI